MAIFRKFCLIILLIIGSFSIVSAKNFEESKKEAFELILGTPIEKEIALNASHIYQINLAENQIAEVVALQQGADVIAKVISPDGSILLEVDSPNGYQGDEIIRIAAGKAGIYKVEIKSTYNQSTVGKYTIKLNRFLTKSELVTDRLAAVGRLWGLVKFTHPYLAYKDIDWDKALLETIPKVKVAQTPEEFRQAVNYMLSFLEDPITNASKIAPDSLPVNEIKPLSDDPNAYFQVVDDVFILKIAEVLRVNASNNQAIADKVVPVLFAALNKSKNLVFDCRVNNSENISYFLWGNVIKSFLSRESNRPITLGSTRYRVHEGYAPQAGNTSGGYRSLLSTETPSVLAGNSKTPSRPIVILINQRTPDFSDVWSGLQASGLAKIIQDGDIKKALGGTTQFQNLPEGVTAQIRIKEFISPTGNTSFEPDFKFSDIALEKDKKDLALDKAIALLKAPETSPSTTSTSNASSFVFKPSKDKTYSDLTDLSEEHRLLALFRFWTVINYLYPYKNLMDKPWADVLVDFIPRFQENKTKLDYEMTVLEMVARIQDSHGYVYGTKEFDKYLGQFAPPVGINWVEGKTVVTRLLSDEVKSVLNLGDTILSINDEPTEKRIELLSKYVAASTKQALMSRVHTMLLCGEEKSPIKLKVKSIDGKEKEVSLTRTSVWYLVERSQPSKQIYETLPNGFGYIDLSRLPNEDSHKALDSMMNAPAIIFDMRGYPNGTAWTIGPRLSEKRNVIGAIFQKPVFDSSIIGDSDYSLGGKFSFSQPLPNPNGAIYKGKVVMLINEEAISQAEHTCLFFESATNVTFIGTPTVGANGDVTNLILPGGIFVNFTGQEVKHADGRQLQRMGIQPNILVAPTIKGVNEKRDEILEAAIEFLEKKAKK